MESNTTISTKNFQLDINVKNAKYRTKLTALDVDYAARRIQGAVGFSVSEEDISDKLNTCEIGEVFGISEYEDTVWVERLN